MTDTSHTPLVLLPGVGADARQFDPQRAACPTLYVPPWLPHESDESLQHYAHRMAKTIRVQPPFYLGGSSFGGMLAQEIAHLLHPEAVFLIASARRGEQIARHLQYFVRFADILPERTFEGGQGVTPLYVKKFGNLNHEQRALLEQMVADTLPAFTRWGIAAITDWPGAADLPMPLHHIHGSDDELIPLENVSPDVIIPGGGHLLNVTHANEVNAFLLKHMSMSPA